MRLFGVFDEKWVCSPNLSYMLQVLIKVLFAAERGGLCGGMLAVVWSLWIERSYRIFDD